MFTEQAMAVLKELEERDAVDSKDGTPKEQRVRCVTPTVGLLLHSLVLAHRSQRILELGTSAGYSTICLASAAAHMKGHVLSLEWDAAKVDWASSNIEKAGLQDVAEVLKGDALALIDVLPGPFDFVFMDHGARFYLDSFAKFKGKLSQSAVLVADGWGNPERWTTEPSLAQYFAAIRNDPEFFTFLLPIEKGELISVRV